MRELPTFYIGPTTDGQVLVHRKGAFRNSAIPTHTHNVGDVLGLQTALDGKSSITHNHTLNSLTPPSGVVNFNGQQATSFCIENRTTDPTLPANGQIWLRTDL